MPSGRSCRWFRDVRAPGGRGTVRAPAQVSLKFRQKPRNPGAYPDRTHACKPGPAFRTQHGPILAEVTNC
jgi:hypothetical protein